MNAPLNPARRSAWTIWRSAARWQKAYDTAVPAAASPRATVRASNSSRCTRRWTGRARHRPQLGVPGEFPFTRGIYASMYRGRSWSQRQLVGLGVPEDYNARVKELLALGASALSFLPCNSVFRGYDADEVPAELLGTCGTVVNHVQDMARAFEGVPIGDISTALNDPAPFTLLAFELALAKKRGVPWARITGTSNQSDSISHFVANHMFFRIALPGARRIVVDHIQFANEHLPGWNPLSIVGQHMQQAGATPAQAMAFTLASAIQYAEDCLARGMDPDRLPAALHLLLRHQHQPVRGSGQVPRRPPHLGKAVPRTFWRQGPAIVALQVPWPDLGRGPDAPAAAEQHRARHGAGHRRHPGRAAVAAHRFLRRSLFHAHRRSRAHCRGHAEHPA
jgi:hypothetical protein